MVFLKLFFFSDMSIEAKKMRIALVTRLDDNYIYIWNTIMGINELRYPIQSIQGIEVLFLNLI